MLLVCFIFGLLGCKDDSETTDPQEEKEEMVISITPSSGIPFDTIRIELANPRPFSLGSVRLNDQEAIILNELNTENELFFMVPIVEGNETVLDLEVQTNLESTPITLEDVFEYKRIQIDSISSNIIFQNHDTIFIYGKNFPKEKDFYRIYEAMDMGDSDFASFVHKVHKVEADKITGVFNNFTGIPGENHSVFLAFGNSLPQFANESNAEFFSLGDFHFSSFFKVLDELVTPDQRFFIRNNNFSDKIFIGDVEATWLFSKPEPLDGFNRLSGYRECLPAWCLGNMWLKASLKMMWN
ncbi:hypothetical protein QQ008_20255 [Fulvivirgaceae bacterium BMA10]|uniref:Uncharacterized protein n=2 Tax=Splendidivirga corallicola TaxID=3051826 RepID=A0ABT8KSJ3_9BACT|nr:hypothetical protein [Fulvivirgaceae bacterium BMA10]